MMSMTRRTWLSIAVAGVSGGLAPMRSMGAQDGEQRELERRIGRLIDEYAQQGFHRTGTEVDRRSGDWLYEEVRRIGDSLVKSLTAVYHGRVKYPGQETA